MEKQTAYCQHCQCNTPVVNSKPPKWWQKNTIWIMLYALGIVIFVGLAGFVGAFPVLILVLISFIGLFSSSNLYCEKCGSYVCHKSEIKNKCVYCGADLAPETTFCSNCGKKFKAVKDSVVCKKCNTENSLASKFCSKCGAKLPEHEMQTGAVQDLSRSDITNNRKVLYVIGAIIFSVLIFFFVDWILGSVMDSIFS